MLDTNLRVKLQHAVAARMQEQIDFTAELVKFPSVRGAEASAQDFVAAALRDRGYAVDRWRLDVAELRHLPGFAPVLAEYENAYNVVGAARCNNPKGRSLILNGHIDVVPVGPLDMWSTPPFVPRVEGGWLYGRGGGDMKAGIAAALYALDAIRDIGYRPAADVFLQSVVEEECTGNGALACLARGYRADCAMIPEPMWNQLIRAQVGVIWFRVHLRGKPVHVREAGAGANAIEAAYEVIQALHELEARWNEAARSDPHFGHLHHPLNMNVGKIAGGDWASSVPAWCCFETRMAPPPQLPLAEARGEIEACIAAAAARNRFLKNTPPRVEYHGLMADAYVLSGAEAAESALRAAHAQAFGGTALRDLLSTGTTDARFYGCYYGIPALVYGPNAEDIHGFDERVELDSVDRITQSMALFIAEWCGIEPR